MLVVVAFGCGSSEEQPPQVASSAAALTAGTAQATLNTEAAAQGARLAGQALDVMDASLDSIADADVGVMLERTGLPARAATVAALDIDAMIGDDLDLAQIGMDQFLSRTPEAPRGSLEDLAECIESFIFQTSAMLKEDGVADAPLARIDVTFIRPEGEPDCRAEGRATIDIDVEEDGDDNLLWLAVTYPEGLLRGTPLGSERTIDAGGSVGLGVHVSDALVLTAVELSADYCATQGTARRVCFEDTRLSVSGSVSTELALRPLECESCAAVYGAAGALIDDLRSENLHLVVSSNGGELVAQAIGVVATNGRAVELGDGVNPISLTVGGSGKERYVLLSGAASRTVGDATTSIAFSPAAGSQFSGFRAATVAGSGAISLDGCVTTTQTETRETCFEDAELTVVPPTDSSDLTLGAEGRITIDGRTFDVAGLTIAISTDSAGTISIDGTIASDNRSLEFDDLSLAWDETGLVTLGGTIARQTDGESTSLSFCEGTAVQIGESSLSFEGCVVAALAAGMAALGSEKARLSATSDTVAGTLLLDGPVSWEPEDSGGRSFAVRFTAFSIHGGTDLALIGTATVDLDQFSATLSFAKGFTAQRTETNLTLNGTVSLQVAAADGSGSATGTIALTMLTVSHATTELGEAQTVFSGTMDMRFSELELARAGGDYPSAHIRLAYGDDSGPFALLREIDEEGLGAMLDGRVAVCMARDCDAVDAHSDLTGNILFGETHSRWTEACGWSAPDAGSADVSDLSAGPALGLTVVCTCKGKANRLLVPSALSVLFDGNTPVDGSASVPTAEGQCDLNADTIETCDEPGELFFELKTCE